nr:methylated-DNA--[protein]-cysteine S-methyltransferase [Pelagicoccus albus]
MIRFTCPISVEGTSFQKRVWTKLAEIPFGTTKSYGQIATELGQPTAARAVGGANNKNPIPIVIPCHRVVGAQKVLVGFAGGLWRKQWMLEHEGIHLPLG